jgi:cytochrome c553
MNTTHLMIITWKRTAATAAGIALLSGTALAADVAANWTTHCVSCHGKDGKGQTKAGRMAGAKDHTDPKFQASVTDEQMFHSIKHGMKEGNKELMKPFAEKLSDEEIKALVARVRSFKK